MANGASPIIIAEATPLPSHNGPLAARARPQKRAPRPRPNPRQTLTYKPLLCRPTESPSPDSASEPGPTTFFDLPPELRIEIYKLALRHIILRVRDPERVAECRKGPCSGLVLASKQVRAEVRPLMYRFCTFRTIVTDLDFRHLEDWLTQVKQDGNEAELACQPLITSATTTSYASPSGSSNSTPFCNSDSDTYVGRRKRLLVNLVFRAEVPPSDTTSLRQWLRARSDPYRTQFAWRYRGHSQLSISGPLYAWMRRRHDRMKEGPEKQLFRCIVTRCGYLLPGHLGAEERRRWREEAEIDDESEGEGNGGALPRLPGYYGPGGF